MRKKAERLFILLILTFTLGFLPTVPEEGMFPLSEIHKLDLKEAGLKIDIDEIYNPNGVSLIDALVNIGGCTGSFVSDDGLMITNHHCAFGVINRASTPEKNYLESGFSAKNYSEEIPALGYTVRITESYEDVSEQILSAAEGIDDPIKRSEKIFEKIAELEDAATDEENSMSARVSEMFIGKTYVLFRYRMIRDVRLVFAPPRSIGEFGGESDNWVWPRHTGDFSFMRAYVAPDGSAAEFSEENIPYSPKKFLHVNADGVGENDFVFILGYPGRTYRHHPSQYIEFQKQCQLPYISALFGWMINLYQEESGKSPELELKYASIIKGYANTMKNYRGKMKGLRRINIIGDKKAEEKAMMDFVAGNADLKEKYGGLFNDLDDQYSKLNDIGFGYFWFRLKNRLSRSFDLLDNLINYVESKEIDDADRDRLFKDENRDRLKSYLERAIENLNPELEIKIAKKILNDASGFENGSKILALSKFDTPDKINSFAERIVNSDLFEKDRYFELLEKSTEELMDIDDPVLAFMLELSEQGKQINEYYNKIKSKLTILLADFVDLKQAFTKGLFVPDANGTLRLTYGYVEGYSPADAVYYSPITTLGGVIEKSYSGGEYEIPEKLKEIYEKDEQQNKTRPVAILYSTDTTGGNSGSPILNAYGEIVGVNFDRAYEATINDFAWDKSYSRSIGVDIRYVIWVTQNFGGAQYLFDEMGL